MIKIAYLPVGMMIGEAQAPDKNGMTVFKKPRVIQISHSEGGRVEFGIGQAFGMPEFLEVPQGTMICDVHDPAVLGSYRESVTGLVLANQATPPVGNVRVLRG